MTEVVAHHGWFKDTKLHVDDTGGPGRPVVLIHGWPLSGESWSAQVPALVDAGHRVVTYDRRGFGRSDKPKTGYTYDALAEDLHTLLVELDLRDVTLVGFSMGGGEVARYLATYGPERVRSVVFASSVTPYLAKTPGNPDGPLPESEAAKMAAGLTADQDKFYDQFTTDFFSVDEAVGELEIVHLFDGAMPTGVSVSHSGRVFVNFPKWGDDVGFTVAEIRDGELVAYPDQAANDNDGDADPNALVSVQSIVVDPADRLWILDTGSPMFQPTEHGGPKLVCVDLTRDEVAQTILFPTDVALPTTYLNDVRFDLRRGEAGTAFITDSSDQGPNGIIVVDLATGESWRRLHEHPTTKAETPPDLRMIVEGEEFLERSADGTTNPVLMGADGIAIAADGSRLYYCCLASRRWWSVSVDALLDRSQGDDAVAATVVDEGDKGSVGDGMETDAAGRLYITDGEHNAIHRRHPDGRWETVVHDPRLLWPDTMSVAADGHLYVTANQLYRQDKYRGGRDERRKPYTLFRTPIDAGPIELRRA